MLFQYVSLNVTSSLFLWPHNREAHFFKIIFSVLICHLDFNLEILKYTKFWCPEKIKEFLHCITTDQLGLHSSKTCFWVNVSHWTLNPCLLRKTQYSSLQWYWCFSTYFRAKKDRALYKIVYRFIGVLYIVIPEAFKKSFLKLYKAVPLYGAKLQKPSFLIY